jgi:integrase
MGIRALRRFDDVPAAQFGPLLLHKLMEQLVHEPLRRGKDAAGNPRRRPRVNINATVKSIRLMFKWAVGRELVPAAVYAALAAVPLLRKGRTEAPERPRRQAVADAVIDATIPHLPKMVGDMIRIQRLVGCRPGELCQLRPGDLEEITTETGVVWVWTLGQHKNEWRGHDARRFVGPRAQAILKPYLERSKEDYCFIASESELERNKLRRSGRKSPMTPSQKARQANAARRAREKTPLTEDAYRRAVTRACEKHGIERWTPHQLRHAAAEETRREMGLDAAQARLGTKGIAMTEHYAKLTIAAGIDVALRLG